MSTRAASSRAFLYAALACTAIVAGVDAILLHLTRGVFTHGFEGVLLDGTALRAGYLGLTAALGALPLLLLWCLLVPLGGALGVAPHRVLALCIALGLAAGGQRGVEHALPLLRNEFERSMALVGCNSVHKLGGDYVRRRQRRR